MACACTQAGEAVGEAVVRRGAPRVEAADDGRAEVADDLDAADDGRLEVEARALALCGRLAAGRGAVDDSVERSSSGRS